MATRPVFIPQSTAPFAEEVNCEFKWNGGFALSQKRKNVRAIHGEFLRGHPDSKPLEISTKSENELGVALSAHNLMKFVPSIGRKVPLECVYHGGKLFSRSGRHQELYDVPPIEVKKRLAEVAEGELLGFRFEGKDYPLLPVTAFYDWLYINALLENAELAEHVLEYDAFTDIAYTPGKSMACQARTVAMFVSLYRLGILDRVRNFEEYVEVVYLRRKIEMLC